MTVTITDMRDMLRAEADREPEKVAECIYSVPLREDRSGFVTSAAPSCIVGCVMVNQLDVEPLALLDVGQSAMDVLRQYTHKEYTTDALLLAQVVQRLQDGSNGYPQLPWGRAVEMGVTAVFAHVATWTKVVGPEDLQYQNGQSSDLAGLIVKGIYKAFDMVAEY